MYQIVCAGKIYKIIMIINMQLWMSKENGYYNLLSKKNYIWIWTKYHVKDYILNTHCWHGFKQHYDWFVQILRAELLLCLLIQPFSYQSYHLTLLFRQLKKLSWCWSVHCHKACGWMYVIKWHILGGKTQVKQDKFRHRCLSKCQ